MPFPSIGRWASFNWFVYIDLINVFLCVPLFSLILSLFNVYVHVISSQSHWMGELNEWKRKLPNRTHIGEILFETALFSSMPKTNWQFFTRSHTLVVVFAYLWPPTCAIQWHTKSQTKVEIKRFIVRAKSDRVATTCTAFAVWIVRFNRKHTITFNARFK